ncbi:cathepsin 8-like [Mantella aurantiaca]
MHFNKILAVLSVLIICTWASSFFDEEWLAWKLKYDKTYPSLEEEESRRNAWEDNWHMVQNHNALADQGLSTFRMAMNHFADMTSEKVKSRSCLYATEHPMNVPRKTYGSHGNLPEHVDWRDSKCVTPIRQQGICGSCWAFATVGAIESRLCIKSHELVKLSEQQLVDCDPIDSGCCGGLPVLALLYTEMNGIMKREDYEYTGKKMACSYNSDKALFLNVSKSYSMTGEENMASSVALEGPITVGFGVDLEFFLYDKGIYDGACAESMNHAIIIVGYGTENDEENGSQDYWIIKNSWGEEWGENGYGKIKRKVNKCSISQMAATIDILG